MPKNKTQSQLIWAISIVVALFLAFVTAWLKQATTIPLDQDINMRLVMIDVAAAIVAAAPIFTTGLIVPKYGREEVSSKVSELGQEEAIARLDTPTSEAVRNVDYDKLAKSVLDEKARRDAEQPIRR